MGVLLGLPRKRGLHPEISLAAEMGGGVKVAEAHKPAAC
jgi:hypothetical protein